MSTIVANLQDVQARIAVLCGGAQRSAKEVTLVAVSKTFGAQAVGAAHGAGQRQFGENYVQEALAKMEALQALPGLVWHMIGPLQSNKTKDVAEHFDWVHTVDRIKIAQRLSGQRPVHLPPLRVLVQINVDGSPTKAGVLPQDALVLARQVAALPRLALCGLMAMPDANSGAGAFLKARACFDALRAEGLAIDVLSMGMSADMEAAISAGSTLVRVGSAIFGARATQASTNKT